MATLQGQKLKDTYVELLKLDSPTRNTGVTSTLKAVEDGSGTGTALSLSTNQITSNVDGSAATPAISRTSDTNTGIFFPASDTIAATTNGAERLRIDSIGYVGIGTTSPTVRLHVVGSARVGTGNDYQFDSTLKINGESTGATGYLRFYTNSLERLRIDSNGDVGIGTISPVNKLDVVGSFGRGAPVTKAADFTLADTENWIINNKSGSTCTVTLPAASSWTGREFTIKNLQAQTVISASSNVVPRGTTTAGTAILDSGAGNWATLVSDGTNWVIMCGS